jgi:glycosyltransferase involved in cell wall biosynthesis
MTMHIGTIKKIMCSIIYSIVLPLYKQESHIDDLVSQYVKGLESQPYSWELILVVNGNKDGCFSKAVSHAKQDKRIIALELKEGGWGRAVKCGMAGAKGKLLCYTNSARTQISDLLLILNYARVNTEAVVKASRIVRASLLRKVGSVLYNFQNRILFQTAIMDVNGTPKVFPRKVWETLNIYSEEDLIDAEAVAKCFRKGIPIVEVPVRITNRRDGKSTTRLRSAFKMYAGLVSLHRRLSNEL